MNKELLKGLTQEQLEKVKKCKNQQEILALIKEEGVELNQEQLEAVSGGSCGSDLDVYCPYCGDWPVTIDGDQYYCVSCKRHFGHRKQDAFYD